jgi:transcriptional antiterminator NusG
MRMETTTEPASGPASALNHALIGGPEWFAIIARSRHEFVTRDELMRKGIETFLPSCVRSRQWRDRRKNVEFPVFPGYLFVRVSPGPEEFLQVLKTRGTVSLISLEPGKPTPVPPEEIEGLRTVLASGRSFDIYPGYQIGARVRVRRGPLQGAEGVLAKKDGSQLFFVNVEILGRSVGLRLCPEDLELI